MSFAPLSSAARAPNGTTNGATTNPRTLNTLKRWSCNDNDLPPISSVKHLHVYDFDNTLFKSPLPNKALWNAHSTSILQSQDVFISGGWWHDAGILASTGEGVDVEEKRGFDGWWNENVLNLARMSMEQPDALNVLLTGRNEVKFADLIKRILASQNLEFDMVCLRPEVGPSNQKLASTMKFKQMFLEDLVRTYSDANEITIYEDRPPHQKAFHDLFIDLNDRFEYPSTSSSDIPRKRIAAKVIEVAEESVTLDPIKEVAEVQRMINAHNVACRDGTAPATATPKAIHRNVFYTAYLVEPKDSERLLSAASLSSSSSSDGEIRTLANSIMISPRPASQAILDKVGGLGAKVRWRATATGSFDNKVWAMKVHAVPTSTKTYTETPTPCVVLALRRNARPYEANRIQGWNSLPPNRSFEFEATVGEKVVLRIEDERQPHDDVDSGNIDDGSGRKRAYDDDYPALGASAGKSESRKPPSGPSAGNSRGGSFRSGRNKGHENRGGRGNRGQGRRGGRGGYRSLDDKQRPGYAGPGQGSVDVDTLDY